MITKCANGFEKDTTLVLAIVLKTLGVTLTAGLKRLELGIALWSHANR